MYYIGEGKLAAFLRSRVVAYAVTALALAYLVSCIPVSSLVEALRTCDVRWVVAAAALVPLNLTLQAAKWRLVLHIGGVRAQWRDVWRSLLGGLALGALTPWRVGEFARGTVLPEASVGAVALLTVVDKASTLVALFLVGAVGTLSMLHGGWMAVVVMALVAAGWGWQRPGPLVRSLARLATSTGWGDLTGQVIVRLRGFTWRERGRILVWSTAFVAVWSGQCLALVRAWGPFDVAVGMLAVPAMFLVRALIPAPAGGFGVREALGIAFLDTCGVEPASAALAATGLFVLNVALPAALGVPIALRRS